MKKGPNLPGPIFPTLPIFRTIFFISIITLFGILLYIRPDFFRDPHSQPHFATHIRDPISRLTFATPFHDSHSRPHFATHIRDPHSRLTFATHFRDSRSRLHSRLHFTTRVRDHTRDSRSRLPIALPTATRYFLSRLPSCDSTTDGRTVLTPQRHLPSVPTLTLLKKIWNLLPGLTSTTSSHPPSCPHPPVALCPLTRLLAPPPLQRPLHLLPGPFQHPHLYHTP